MSVQIAVRLPEELVTYIDGLVEGDVVKSRAEFVAVAIKGERRRRATEADIEIVKRLGENSDLAALVDFQAKNPTSPDA